MLSPVQSLLKRTFDLVFAFLGIIIFSWLILLAWLAASIDTRSNGFFIQTRIGQFGRLFKVVKIKTMRPVKGTDTTVTKRGDPRITKLGAFFRKTKIDELPQLWNVLIGQMSFVGPRPDVPGYADQLDGEQRKVLQLKPGITGPATLKYRNEEDLLAQAEDPQKFNDEVIFPDKVRVNIEYMESWSFSKDLKYIVETVVG
ncbi:sugar transferase [Idiomarina sp. HB]|uniref:sugar transferase n=1 Tax=Idiomarina sp. HB TaxID=3110479 RepID=UPI003A804122